MMSTTKCLAAAVLATSLAGCLETMDAGYAAPSYGGYGYNGGYYAGGYYPSQAYYAPPVVYSQTRYVPVPTPVQQADHRWDGHDATRREEPRHVERQPTPAPPATHNGGSSSGSHTDGHADRDRNSDHHS